MKSGTAQKMILNMLSTATMIKLGKTYGNLMVDVKATNKKLISRAVRIVCMATEVDADTALKVLQESDFMVKNAILMILAKVNFEDSKVILAKNEGRIALALKTQKQ
jgi:N-acetylmuramic acid 6-phosphate etherase